MKIIFDSEQDKEHFLSHCCASEVKLGTRPYCGGYSPYINCAECFANAGIELCVEKEES